MLFANLVAFLLATGAQALYFTAPQVNTVWDSPEGQVICEFLASHRCHHRKRKLMSSCRL